MGNSGWCMSKQVEYQTGETYRSRNSEFLFNNGEIGVAKDVAEEKSPENMENSLKIVEKLKEELPVADKDAQMVSNRLKNSINEPFLSFVCR